MTVGRMSFGKARNNGPNKVPVPSSPGRRITRRASLIHASFRSDYASQSCPVLRRVRALSLRSNAHRTIKNSSCSLDPNSHPGHLSELGRVDDRTAQRLAAASSKVGVLGRGPKMIDRSIGIEIGKPVTFGVMTVHVRVADVVIVIRGELGFDLIELVLQDGERDGNAVLGPDAPLIADGPVRAASHDVSQLQRSAH